MGDAWGILFDCGCLPDCGPGIGSGLPDLSSEGRLVLRSPVSAANRCGGSMDGSSEKTCRRGAFLSSYCIGTCPSKLRDAGRAGLDESGRSTDTVPLVLSSACGILGGLSSDVPGRAESWSDFSPLAPLFSASRSLATLFLVGNVGKAVSHARLRGAGSNSGLLSARGVIVGKGMFAMGGAAVGDRGVWTAFCCCGFESGCRCAARGCLGGSANCIVCDGRGACAACGGGLWWGCDCAKRGSL